MSFFQINFEPDMNEIAMIGRGLSSVKNISPSSATTRPDDSYDEFEELRDSLCSEITLLSLTKNEISPRSSFTTNEDLSDFGRSNLNFVDKNQPEIIRPDIENIRRMPSSNDSQSSLFSEAFSENDCQDSSPDHGLNLNGYTHTMSSFPHSGQLNSNFIAQQLSTFRENDFRPTLIDSSVSLGLSPQVILRCYVCVIYECLPCWDVLDTCCTCSNES
jgi:hypothetical protein